MGPVLTSRNVIYAGAGRTETAVEYEVKIWTQMDLNGVAVDSAPYPWSNSVPPITLTMPTFHVPTNPTPFVTTIASTNGAEVVDPRYNWDTTINGAGQWFDYTLAATVLSQPATAGRSARRTVSPWRFCRMQDPMAISMRMLRTVHCYRWVNWATC